VKQKITAHNFVQFLDSLKERGVAFEGFRPNAFWDGRRVVGDSNAAFVAGDPAPIMQTPSNGGIPAFATQVMYPVVYKQLFAPLNATRFYSERQSSIGWAGETEFVPRTEDAYEVVGYSDHSRTGSTHVNAAFEFRQQARIQIMNEWGDLEQQRYGRADIPFVAYKQQAAIAGINRTMNRLYMYGVAGMPNFGLLNDPSLLAPIAPNPNSNGEVEWCKKDGTLVYQDIVTLVARLIANNRGLIDENSLMKLGVGPSAVAYLQNVNALGNRGAIEMIKSAFPNMEIVTIPEFDSVNGGLVQIKAEELGGQKVGECVYGQKLLTYPLYVEHSTSSQKLAAGSLGTIIYMPSAIVQMVGVGVNPVVSGGSK